MEGKEQGHQPLQGLQKSLYPPPLLPPLLQLPQHLSVLPLSASAMHHGTHKAPSQELASSDMGYQDEWNTVPLTSLCLVPLPP